MTYFPMFIDIKNKSCVVFGGGKVAYRKIKTLKLFDANIVVVSKTFFEKIENDIEIEKIYDIYRKKYLKNKFLAIGATNSKDINNKIFEDSVKKKIFVNTVNSIKKSSFIFPAVVKRGDFILGISSTGVSPAFVKKIRRNLDEVLPFYYEDILSDMKKYRPLIKKKVDSAEIRRDMMEKIINKLIIYYESTTIKFDIDRFIEEYLNEKDCCRYKKK